MSDESPRAVWSDGSRRKSPKELLQERIEFREADETARAVIAERKADAEGTDSWAPIDWHKVEKLPEPSIMWIPEGPSLGRYLIRRGWLWLVHGQEGCGKTPLVVLALVEQVKRGKLVAIIDYEMGAAQMKLLLLELGLTAEQIDHGVLMIDNPGAISAKRRERLADEIRSKAKATGREFVAAMIDSLTESMSSSPGANDNDAQDVGVWFDALPDWLLGEFQRQIAVVVIDHSGNIDGPRPSGSHKKKDAPQGRIWVRKKVPFSRKHENGCSEVLVVKDRSGINVIGVVVAELRTKLGDTFYLAEPGGTGTKNSDGSINIDVGDGLGFTDEEEDQVTALLAAAGARGCDTTALTSGGGGNSTGRRRALKWMFTEGQLKRRKDSGKNGPMRYWLLDFAPDDSNTHEEEVLLNLANG